MSQLAKLISILTMLSAMALGLDRMNLPDPTYWDGKIGWLVLALVITSVSGTVQTFAAERGEKRRRLQLEREREVQEALMIGLLDLVDNCGVNWRDVGVRAFLSKPGLFHTRHERIGAVKLNLAASSGIEWTDGKGVVGQCWKTKGERQFDNLENYSHYTDATWGTAPQTYGMNFAEMKVLRERYGVVAAVPIRAKDDARYLGCVTMDTEPKPQSVPDKSAVWKSLGVTSALVRLAVKS